MAPAQRLPQSVTRPVWPWRVLAAAVVAAALAGCAATGRHPPSATPDLYTPIPGLRVPAAGQTASRRFDPDDGLDLTEAAVVAVLGNPDLNAARNRAGGVAPQIFAAGLLARPRPADPARARSRLGRALDAMVRSRVGAGAAPSRLDLTFVWNEWQVAQGARLLAARKLAEHQRLRLLKQYGALYDAQQQRDRQAGGSGGAALAAGLDLHKRSDALEEKIKRTGRTLNAVLGLAPHLAVPVVAGGLPAVPSDKTLDSALSTLAHRRPDLIALGRAANASRAEQAQVLARFEPITVTVPDAGHSAAQGVVDVRLPFFDSGRGRIEPANANGDFLNKRFRERLQRDRDTAHALTREYRRLHRLQVRRQSALKALQQSVEQARDAYAGGNLPAGAFITMERHLLERQLGVLERRQHMAQIAIALQTLLYLPTRPLQTGR